MGTLSSFRVRNANIWYEVEGKGAPILQIGGAGFAHENFSGVKEQFIESNTVIDFDHRGYGNSDKPDQLYTIEGWADDCADLIRELGCGPVNVHGTSMGGMMAISLAERYPELIDNLIIGSSAAKADYTFRANLEIWKALAEAAGMNSHVVAQEIATKALTRNFLDTSVGASVVEAIPDTLERNCSLSIFKSSCDAMINMDLVAGLEKITARTLVMAGAEDVLTPIDQGPSGAGSRMITELIPNAQMYVFEHTGHGNLLEAPEESVAVIRKFLGATD
ncbi:MAG: alpha/beta hydrolase [Microbacteriaceae bacterium]